MAATYEPIASQTLGSDSATVSFTSIPGTYTDLILVYSARSARAVTAENIYVNFNSDTGSNYSRTELTGNGSTAGSGRLANQTKGAAGYIAGTSSTAGIWDFGHLSIMSYANTNVFKTCIIENILLAGSIVGRQVTLWRSTSAITSIDLTLDSGNILAASTFSLFGVKAA